MSDDFSRHLPDIIKLAQIAGEAILSMPRGVGLKVTKKADKTPVSEADLVANRLIETELAKISEYPIISEEGEQIDFATRQNWQTFWLVDPLDGTRGFLEGRDEYTVNIALIHEQQPILGVVYAPAKNALYYAAKNFGAFAKLADHPEQKLQAAKMTERHLHVLVGQHYNPYRIKLIENEVGKVTVSRVNSSLKFCLLAKGDADIYARFGPISEWDTGAGHCILLEAGGTVVDFKGHPLQYNASNSLNWPPFVAMGDKSQVAAMLNLFEKVRSKM